MTGYFMKTTKVLYKQTYLKLNLIRLGQIQTNQMRYF